VTTCRLAEGAVSVTEQEAVPGPEAARVQLEAGEKTSVPTEEEKLTVPAGEIVTPADVDATVAVTVTGWPMIVEPLENETTVEVEPAVTVSWAAALDAL
jgi:hypothetical protein